MSEIESNKSGLRKKEILAKVDDIPSWHTYGPVKSFPPLRKLWSIKNRVVANALFFCIMKLYLVSLTTL